MQANVAWAEAEPKPGSRPPAIQAPLLGDQRRLSQSCSLVDSSLVAAIKGISHNHLSKQLIERVAVFECLRGWGGEMGMTTGDFPPANAIVLLHWKPKVQRVISKRRPTGSTPPEHISEDQPRKPLSAQNQPGFLGMNRMVLDIAGNHQYGFVGFIPTHRASNLNDTHTHTYIGQA